MKAAALQRIAEAEGRVVFAATFHPSEQYISHGLASTIAPVERFRKWWHSILHRVNPNLPIYSLGSLGSKNSLQIHAHTMFALPKELLTALRELLQASTIFPSVNTNGSSHFLLKNSWKGGPVNLGYADYLAKNSREHIPSSCAGKSLFHSRPLQRAANELHDELYNDQQRGILTNILDRCRISTLCATGECATNDEQWRT